MSGNPVFRRRGITDPHIKIFDNRYYLYASHDEGPGLDDYTMPDWWIWSSSDLVDWTHECTIDPQRDTYIDYPLKHCFAVDAAERNGKYYLYFSEYTDSIGVLVADTPVGPWRDPLGKPLVTQGLVNFHRVYDPAVFIDDDQTPYLIFGHCRHFIGRLNDDMISFAEPPQQLDIAHCNRPDCHAETEDKPFVHKHNGIYYLSIGAYYAMSDSLLGPYTCMGAFFKEENFPESHRFKGGITFDRHGSFFKVGDQWYLAANDLSQTQDDYFRDFSIFRINYRPNGEIIPPVLEPEGIRVELPANCRNGTESVC